MDFNTGMSANSIYIDKKIEYKSKVYTDRPSYADFEAPAKFEAIKSIIAKKIDRHPNAICSYSGGSDSDIMLHLIETIRKTFNLPPVKYCFFNTGLEMEGHKEPCAKDGRAIWRHNYGTQT